MTAARIVPALDKLEDGEPGFGLLLRAGRPRLPTRKPEECPGTWRTSSVASLKTAAGQGIQYVFPGRIADRRLVEINRLRYAVRHAAQLDDVRLHDLRHSFASVSASSGGTLLIIGKLLGHRGDGHYGEVCAPI